MSREADALLFGDALGFDDRLPLAFSAGGQPGGHWRAQATLLLRALALFDESRDADCDDADPQRVELHRIEAKLDVVIALLGSVLGERANALPPVVLRWSRVGVRFRAAATPALGAGCLRLQPDSRLPQVIELPVDVVAVRPEAEGDSTVWARFVGVDEPLEAALERHVFRRHRRQVAESRRGATA
jgi:hypothetical protein